MNNRNIIPSILASAFLVSAQSALADFRVIDEKQETKPSTPLEVATERSENERLRAELDQILAELARIKQELQAARDESAQLKALVSANKRLDNIEHTMEKAVVSFAFGTTKFAPQPEVAQRVADYARRAKAVNIHGYTDSRGSNAANHRVALRRAVSTKEYLISQGVEEMKINTFGHVGEYVAPNTTRAGRLANRRVEIEFQP